MILFIDIWASKITLHYSCKENIDLLESFFKSNGSANLTLNPTSKITQR